MRAWLLSSLVIVTACSGPSGPPDIFDGHLADAGRCGAAPSVSGEFVDWDSSDASFHGVAFATFAIDGDSDPLHTDTSAPNGRIEMCIPSGARALIKITPGASDKHLGGHLIADPAVFSSGRLFSLRGITAARAATFFTEHGLTYDAGKGQLFVNEIGTASTVTLTGATAEATLASADGVTWAPGASGTYVLFANVTGASGTVGGATLGGGSVTLVAGEMTYTSVATP